MKRTVYSDPLARAGVIGAEAPLFAPREIEPPKHVGHRPMASTSLAAHSPRSSGRNTDERRVFELCKQPNGVTIDEAAQAMGKTSNEVSGRFSALEDRGVIGRSGITRATRRGKQAAVWKHIPHSTQTIGGAS